MAERVKQGATMIPKTWHAIPPRQQRAIEYLANETRLRKRVPSYRTIARTFEYASLNAVAELVDALERRGLVMREKGRVVVTPAGFLAATDVTRREMQEALASML